MSVVWWPAASHGRSFDAAALTSRAASVIARVTTDSEVGPDPRGTAMKK